MIDRIHAAQSVQPLQQSTQFQTGNTKAAGSAVSFEELLQRRQESQSVAFSKHARERAEQRGIQVDDQLMGQLNDTVERAQAKGATNILAFDTTRAFIINVPNGRVITTMSPEEMKENIFTNIDGAVIL